MNRLIVLFAVIMCGTLNIRAQFKVVDADDGLPLPGPESTVVLHKNGELEPREQKWGSLKK